MKYYYTNAANQPSGPVDLAELARLAAAGTINDNTSVIAEGGTAWVPYRQIRQQTAAVSTTALTPVGLPAVPAASTSFSWGDFFYGAWLVIRSVILMPLSLLKTAFSELSSWGRSRSLPSTASELPVLTLLIVAMRPFVHLFWTFVFLLDALVELAGHSLFHFTSRGYYDSSYSFSSALGGFLVALLFAYFINWVIGYFFEALSLLVRIANDINKLTKR